MFKCLISVFFFFAFPFNLISRILPEEGRSLNYRIIGFYFPTSQNISNYKLEIATGYYYSEDSFRKNIIKTFSGKNDKMIAEVPSFGCQYTWRAVYSGPTSVIMNSELHHFSTSMCPELDTAHNRLRILKAATKYKDAYVFLDGNKVLYDMNGHPIWYLPNRYRDFSSNLRDLKISPFGTITFLLNDFPYEVNYNGDILWKGPNKAIVSGDSTEHYHHEFTRLANGHYMVLGTELPLLNKMPQPGSLPGIPGNGRGAGKDTLLNKASFGTILEYDEQDSLVWSWSSSNYFERSDLINYVHYTGRFIDVHENSFFFDEKNKIIYVSFKNISRVLKIKYPGGAVVNSYGEEYKHGLAPAENHLFCGQHACKRSQTGSLYMFDNNGCNRGYAPKIKVFQEPAFDKGSLKKIWEYECTVEDNYPKGSPSGGNVMELPDRSYFVSMGGTYSKIFIVNGNKEIVWSALPERCEDDKQWHVFGEYRASIVYDRKQMERLIWNTGTKN